MKKMKIALVLGFALIGLVMLSTAFAAVDITATVNNQAPSAGAIRICDGVTCAYNKSLNPATQFTVEVNVTDPNGQADINADAFEVQFFTDGDTPGSGDDWDHNTLTNVSSVAASQGCAQAGSTYCLVVPAASWTTKFLKGNADVYVKAYDNTGANDNNTLDNGITVNAAVLTSQDAASVTYSGDPNSTNNAMSPASIETTHNGNTDINVTVTATDLISGAYTVGDGNMHWDLAGTPPGTSFTGGADTVNSNFTRGADPISNTFDLYTWLNIPAAQPAGSYTGTFTFNSVES